MSTREPVAVVLGDRIYRDELMPGESGERLAQMIHAPIMRQYLREHDLTVSKKELTAYMKQGDEPLDNDLMDREGREFFRSIVESIKFGRSLFEAYGGRVTISSFGFVGALDAQETFMRKRMNDGAFAIFDPALEQAFWATVTNEWGDATLSEEKAREMFNEPAF